MGGTLASPVVSNNTLTGKRSVQISTGSTPTINVNNFIGGSTDTGIVYTGTIVINAQNNYWGDSSGPTHLSNPDGIGVIASDNIDYSGFALTPFVNGVLELTPPANIVVAAVDASGTPSTNVSINAFLNAASAWDNIDGAIVPTHNAPTIFPLGVTTVIFSATDSVGIVVSAPATVTVVDQTPPILSLIGSQSVTIDYGSLYIEEGAVALDNVDGNISGSVVISGSVDTNNIGVYTLTYGVSDTAGNVATPVVRSIIVQDVTAPAITPPANIIVPAADATGTPVTDSMIVAFLSSASANDNVDGVITSITHDAPGQLPLGTSTITFSATDNAGNIGTAQATITVADQTAPMISLIGSNSETLNYGAVFNDLGAIALDNVDGNISSNIQVIGSVNTNSIGVYTLTYNVSDSAGNAATPVVRSISVQDMSAPVITPPGNLAIQVASNIGLSISDSLIVSFIEGASVTDDVDVGLLITNDAPSVFPLGVTTVTFQAVDSAGNIGAAQATVTITSSDNDGDGMPNDWELLYGFDPENDLDAFDNADADSLTNIGEYLAGTNPLLADTDGDGVNDDVDVFPLDIAEWLDSDGDGIGDNADPTPYPPAGILDLTTATETIAENGSSITLTVERTNGSYGTVTLDYATQDGSATASVDYQATTGTLSFADGEISKTITLNILDDATYEVDENFTLVLNNAQGGATLGTQASTEITITNDDPVPPAGELVFSAASYSVGENGTSVSTTVDRINGSYGAVSVDYVTSDNSAVAGSDYQAATGTLNFGDGVTSQSFTVTIVDDSIFEGDELFNLALSNIQGGASLGFQSTAQVTIVEDEAAPPAGVLQLDSASYTASESDSAVTVAVTRSGGSYGEITANYATSNNTAIAGSDYQAVTGSVVFADGVTSQSIDISLVNDQAYEGDETFGISLTGASGVLGSVTNAQITIQDNDPIPPAGVLQFSGASYAVNEDGTSVVLTVLRTNGSYGDISVDYTTADDTATDGFDYQATIGTLLFADGETTQTITVPIDDDLDYEGDERFTVTLSNAQGNATLGTIASVTVYIADNEVAPDSGVIQFSGSSYSVNEGDGAIQIIVMRTNGSTGTASIDYATENGTASANEDYQAATGTLVFADGETSKVINITVLNDQTVEGAESFTVSLSNPVGVSVSGSSNVTVQIQDNDSNADAGSNSSGGGGGSLGLYELMLFFAWIWFGVFVRRKNY